MNLPQVHSIDDEALSRLSKTEDAGGDLVRSFRHSRDTDDRNWLETWFQARIEKHFYGALSKSDVLPSFELPAVSVETAPPAPSVKLKSVRAHYFRGFREGSDSACLAENFVVIEGRNSSGKTSLAEALEWLLTGVLSRRERSDPGNARELEQCITNQFRPDHVDTWVSATFILGTQDDTKEFVLRRVLREDYGTTATATCSSVLLVDGKELSPEKERQVLDRLFTGVPPLLLQHTLRDFVQGDPKRRREYFERLLRLDELTELIRQAVISDDRAADVPSPSGSKHLRLWQELGPMLEDELSSKAHNRLVQSGKGDIVERVTDALSTIARAEFPALLDRMTQSDQVIEILKDEQSKARQESFPILSRLRPKRPLPDHPQEPTYASQVESLSQKVHESWKEYAPAQLAAQAIGDANFAVSEAFRLLLDAGVIQHGTALQTCPICTYENADTLTASRIASIQSWDPIREAEHSARLSLRKALNSLVGVVRKVVEEYDEFLPPNPSGSDWDAALDEAGNDLREVVANLRIVIDEQANLAQYLSNGRALILNEISHATSIDECENFIRNCVEIVNGMAGVPTEAARYRDAFLAVEAAVGAKARMDPQYRLREGLIECSQNATIIASDLQWEQAKQLAQKDLRRIRASLLTYRQQFLESKRTSFNIGIESVWGTLRGDRYSSFSQLHIPPPRGKGFPIEIELKALLDDGNCKIEVDALRVFSESQVNALGIAAFVTRAKLLGHRILIFDDPVQSMDEEHFKTFARDLIPHILDEGFQIILLTHNDTFARDVSHYHYGNPDYVTMSIRHSRRQGSVVEEGNRRVPERLKLAEHKLEQGHLGEAWKYIRLAIERLYTIAYAKYGPNSFEPESWQHQTAQYMWNNGAGGVIRSRLPNAESRLRDILDMTVGGTHDAAPRGETDLRHTVTYLRSALTELGVGG